MGSGISCLTQIQTIELIKVTLKKEFDMIELSKPPYVDGYIAYYDFSDEQTYNNKIKLLNNILYEIKQHNKIKF
jgi:hypothetical protein